MGQTMTGIQASGMIGIVIVAHGGLAGELLGAAEHVMGRQPGIRTVRIDPDYDKPAKAAEIRVAADAVDTGAGVVVLVDLHGSSPANLCRAVRGPAPRHILTGANVPMLIKLLQSRNLPLDQAAALALVSARKYIDGRDIGPAEDDTA